MKDGKKIGVAGTILMAACTFGMMLYIADAALYQFNPAEGTMISSFSDVLSSATDYINAVTGIDKLI